jgi:hypothetical protein
MDQAISLCVGLVQLLCADHREIVNNKLVFYNYSCMYYYYNIILQYCQLIETTIHKDISVTSKTLAA